MIMTTIWIAALVLMAWQFLQLLKAGPSGLKL
jgi:hypothetical protein